MRSFFMYFCSIISDFREHTADVYNSAESKLNPWGRRMGVRYYIWMGEQKWSRLSEEMCASCAGLLFTLLLEQECSSHHGPNDERTGEEAEGAGTSVQR